MTLKYSWSYCSFLDSGYAISFIFFCICIIMIYFRFCHDAFDRDYKATIGVDFEVEKFSVLSTPFTLQM